MKKSIVLILTMLLGLGSLLAGADAAETPKFGGTLRVAIPNAPPNLDPYISTANETVQVIWHVYEGLFEPNKKFEVKPHLARRVTESSDHLRYNIELRQGVLFHDGSEMTSQDVVASFDRWLKLNNGGKELAPHIKAYRPEGKYNFIVEFKNPYGPFLAMMASHANNQKFVIFKKEIVEKFGDKIITEHIGTGPFKFSKWMPNQYAEMVRFDNYKPADGPGDWYSGKRVAYVDKLIYEFIKEEATRVAGVETGQYDYAQEVPTDQYDQFAASANVRPHVIEPDVSLNIVFNRKKGRLFSNVNARRAIAAALNMEEILGSGYGNPRFWNLNFPWFQKGTPWYTEKGKDTYNVHDLEKAKKLLAQAGYDGKPIKVLGDLTSGTGGMAVAIKNQLKPLGMEAVLDLMERASMAEKRRGDDWDIHLCPFRAAYPVPEVYAGWVGTNKWIGFWDDEDSRKIDAMFDDLSKTVRHDQRFQKYEKLMEVYMDVTPIIKIGEANRLQILHKRVKGFESTTWPVFYNVWID
jgi:peptide/nickel transport system substrate-binding protein